MTGSATRMSSRNLRSSNARMVDKAEDGRKNAGEGEGSDAKEPTKEERRLAAQANWRSYQDKCKCYHLYCFAIFRMDNSHGDGEEDGY